MAEKAKKERTKTTYEVFRLNEVGLWQWYGDTAAYNGGDAISELADIAGDYRAVPTSRITRQQMAMEKPPPPKLVPVVPGQMDAYEVIAEIAEEASAPITGSDAGADPPHSAAGGSRRAPDAEDDGA